MVYGCRTSKTEAVAAFKVNSFFCVLLFPRCVLRWPSGYPCALGGFFPVLRRHMGRVRHIIKSKLVPAEVYKIPLLHQFDKLVSVGLRRHTDFIANGGRG